MNDMTDIFRKSLQLEVAESTETQTKIAMRTGISVAYLNDLIHGRRQGKEDVRRRLASVFGWNDYESFLNVGREALGLPLVKPPPPPRDEPDFLSDAAMGERGFFTVPFSDNMRLAAGEGGCIPVTDDADQSVIVVHGPSIRRHSARNLQAFRVGGPSMEPMIADGGIVLADLAHNDIMHIKDGRIYVLCWDIDEGECAVKYLRWFEKGKIVSIESENSFYKPVLKRINEVVLIGKVFWSWREFPD
ncbi:LexA family transcriptional regulator [Deltaproteobacteria bacterium OttesenSCG-928-M10]|nr:LexA family transcriptional regulator [Deltaproteobacteria bacterium OttesenSCG-928-M10]